MIYMENILVCLAAPLALALLFTKGGTRRFVGFFLAGLCACVAAAYINTFIAGAVAQNGEASMTAAQSVVRLTPICEEVLKALPVLFYAAVFTERHKNVLSVALAIGLGFATMENACYLAQYGAADVWFVLVRGFSAGLMHTVCAAMLGYGLTRVLGRRWVAAPCAFALLCATATFHAVYNLLVAADGYWLIVGYALPAAVAAAMFIAMQHTKTEPIG